MSESRDPAGDSTTTNNMGEVREAEHQGAAVKAALGANIGVAIAKLLAAFFTGSSAMLSESVHSIADCSNEIVLMVGGRFSKRKTDGDHPFGLYRAKYLASFVVATLLFCLQLYGDFGGCSVMAMGTAKILGIDLIDNFNAPYFSQSIAEFWQRWHISLSTWFRDYLYIPLGGNRKGTLRKYLNVLVTFAVSGLWHGAQWNYMAWGLLNGLYQVIGAALMPLRTAVVRALHIDPKSRPHKLLRVVVTFVLFSSTMVFFRAYRLMDAVRIFISMLTVHNFEIFTDGSIFVCGIDAFNFALLGIYVLVIFAADVCKYRRIKVRSVIEKQHWLCQVAVVALGVLTVLLLGVYGPGFEASNFIYSQF